MKDQLSRRIKHKNNQKRTFAVLDICWKLLLNFAIRGGMITTEIMQNMHEKKVELWKCI